MPEHKHICPDCRFGAEEWSCSCLDWDKRWKVCPRHDPREKVGAA